jgi:hypothetical protein
MCQKETRHTLGPINLHRCANNSICDKYARYAKEAREGTIRQSVVRVVKKMKLIEILKKGNGI